MPKVIQESEMEEGEIVDELDDLSDISSEEEFLLRQRLEVLENYNNVLERKEAKRSKATDAKPKREVLCDLSEVSATELEDPHTHITYKQLKIQRHIKPHNKQKTQKHRKDIPLYVDENNIRKKKDYQKKKVTRNKKRFGVKVLSESSDESEDEYRNKRRKLADAVIVPRRKGDKSSLSARLRKMIHGSEAHIDCHDFEHKDTDTIVPNDCITVLEESLSSISSVNTGDLTHNVDVPDGKVRDKNQPIVEFIELSTDDDVKIINGTESKKQSEADEIIPEIDAKECQGHVDKDSDEDLELLRQHALESKPSKSKAPEPNKTENKFLSEDEDSDTAELRLICLKSALLKKAIEMKQKQKLQKKLSQSSNLEDDLFNDADLFSNKEDCDNNNTDIESVDMDMGSDAEEKKLKVYSGEKDKFDNTGLITRLHDNNKNDDLIDCAINNYNVVAKEDELDDDEDLLRAKLLTSLSKNLTNLVSPEILNTVDNVKKDENSVPQNVMKTVQAPEAKKFIIKLDESDSEGEHEATKNLTKMHMKLAEQIDFQQKLDMLLKSTRKEVEKKKLPDVIQKQPVSKKSDKFVAKAVTHLPKSEQIEYKNLVKRMAELEKMKQTRQANLNLLNQQTHVKGMLNSRNVTIDNQARTNINLEQEIAKSRKIIAEESVKILKLKEEAIKLSQRYKIAATELRNISTAITLNKRLQKTTQITLSKIRSQHQSLLKSSSTSLHSKVNGRIPQLSHMSNKVLLKNLNKTISKEEYNNLQIQKTVKISVVNDLVDETIVNNPKLTEQLNIPNDKKVVEAPSNLNEVMDKVIVEDNHDIEIEETKKSEEKQRRLSENNDPSLPGTDNTVQLNDNAELIAVCDHGNKRYYISVDDYKSPLDALGSTTWQADPNAILCPFEVDGQCKDPDCKYLHTPLKQ